MDAHIPGVLCVSNDVIADLAGYTALECYGVVGMAYTDAQNNIVRILSMRSLREGIDVSHEGDALVVDLHIVIEYGVHMISVADNLKSAITFMLKEVAEVDAIIVRVHIDGIHLS